MKLANNHDVPHLDGLIQDNQSQGRLSNISSTNKKQSLTERMNKERNKTGQASLAGGNRHRLPHLDRGATEHQNLVQASQQDIDDATYVINGYQNYDQQSLTDCNSTSDNQYRAQQNLVQRRFPMLREYERSKKMFSMSPNQSRLKNNNSNAYQNNDYHQGELSSVNKSMGYYAHRTTKPSMRQSNMYLAKNSSYETNSNQVDPRRASGKFLLSNKSDARNTIKANNFGLHWDSKYHDEHKLNEIEEIEIKKKERLAGDFKPAFLNNKVPGIARKNEDSFLATAHTFDTFMGEREDLPRLSILSNYEQIMRIMTTNYMKRVELDHRYRNRDKKDLGVDQEYTQYVEEQNNTRKMSNILQRLHSPKKRTNMNYFYREQIKKQMNIEPVITQHKEIRSQMNNYQRAKVDIKLNALKFEKLNRCNTANPSKVLSPKARQTEVISKGQIILNQESIKEMPEIQESLMDQPSMQEKSKQTNDSKNNQDYVISMNDIIEIKSFVHPSQDVITILTYLMLLFNEEPTWDRVKHFFQDATLAQQNLSFLDVSSIDAQSIGFKKVAAFIESYSNPQQLIEQIKNSSIAVAGFAKYIIEVYKRVIEPERAFILEGFRLNTCRRDGRGLLDYRNFKLQLGAVPHGFGSSQLVFGEEETQIICSIKAELQKPLPSQPRNGQIKYHLESSHSGSTLTSRDEQAEYLKKKMVSLISSLYSSIINKEELLVSEGQFSWFLNIDILVMEELSLHQLDYICLAIRAAFIDMTLPSVFVTTNENTGKIEVGLTEEIYEDQENTDTVKHIKSAQNAPYVLSLGFVRNAAGEDSIVIDGDDVELQCVDQILHVSVDSKMRIHAIEQSRGNNYSQAPGYFNTKYLMAANLAEILKPKVQEMEIAVNRMIDI